jgi:hypothetical protein
MSTPPVRGLTVGDVAARYRVSQDKIRRWIRNGDILAVNTASVLCGKPRFVVLPEALAEFEERRAAAVPPKPPSRRRKRSDFIDFYPD